VTSELGRFRRLIRLYFKATKRKKSGISFKFVQKPTYNSMPILTMNHYRSQCETLSVFDCCLGWEQWL